MNNNKLRRIAKQIYEFPGAIELLEKHTIEYNRLIKMVGKIEAFKWAINRVEALNEEIPHEERFCYSCKKGCSFCCHIRVATYLEEVQLIANHCKKNDIPISKAYLLKQRVADQLHLSNVSACVFLKNGACSIYEVRPLICRNYHVISAPELCDLKKHDGTQTRIVLNIQREIFMGAFTQFHKEGLLHEMLLPYGK